MTNRFIPK